MTKINREYEYARPAAVPDWLEEFASRELKKEGNPFEDIRNLFQQKNEAMAVEERVKELRERIGLDKIEKQATIREVERAKERGEGTTKKWCVYPKEGGKALGCHSSEGAARKQLQAIEISKGRAADDFYIQEEDDIFGGFGDGEPDEKFDAEQLEKGIGVELEHTDDPEKAKEIVKDHLMESKDFEGGEGAKYYDKLDEMEEEMKDELTKKNMLSRLIIAANKLEDAGEIESAKAVDELIGKLAESFAKDKKEDVFDKHPKLQRIIDDVCTSRGGHVEVPAVMQMLQSEQFKDIKLTDKDKDQLKKYIKERVDDTKQEMKEDDVSGMNYVVFVVNEDDGNSTIFDGPGM